MFDLDTIKEHYGVYFEYVKDSVDSEGWTYTKDVDHLLDTYFTANTGNDIEFQKSFGRSGDNPYWDTKGSRWRPKSLSDLYLENKKSEN